MELLLLLLLAAEADGWVLCQGPARCRPAFLGTEEEEKAKEEEEEEEEEEEGGGTFEETEAEVRDSCIGETDMNRVKGMETTKESFTGDCELDDRVITPLESIS